MKRVLFYLLIIIFINPSLYAQTGIEKIQDEWVMALKYSRPQLDFSWERGYLMYIEGEGLKTEELSGHPKLKWASAIQGYTHEQELRHDNRRYLTTGMLNVENDSYMLLSGWWFTENGWKKEVDVILLMDSDKEVSSTQDSLLKIERRRWVRLANQHKPEAHMDTSYTPDAVYQGSGKTSAGRDEIARRYAYMGNPNYQVDLEKQQLWYVSEDKVLETGRYYTGAERKGTGGIYVIIWEWQDEGNWQIAFDFNF
ncbi:MAG: nuclear transport factor 2 family protein [Balneolaceae bacterium]|nr:nuclear transport factor 2 family protein [Balneolaceae bacterium]